MRSTRLAILILGTLASLGATAQALGRAPAMACVAPEKLTCGCQIRLQDQVCANRKFERQPQLFTELHPDAPLLMVLDGQEQTLRHVRHTGKSVKGDPPGISSDLYVSEPWQVEVHYRPGRPTCPKEKVEGCEFVDVSVRVKLSRQGKEVLNTPAIGECGC